MWQISPQGPGCGRGARDPAPAPPGALWQGRSGRGLLEDVARCGHCTLPGATVSPPVPGAAEGLFTPEPTGVGSGGVAGPGTAWPSLGPLGDVTRARRGHRPGLAVHPRTAPRPKRGVSGLRWSLRPRWGGDVDEVTRVGAWRGDTSEGTEEVTGDSIGDVEWNVRGGDVEEVTGVGSWRGCNE